MEYELKRISTAGIAEAIAKVELYRILNEPEEAESICRDILTIAPQHQLALRLLGLALTDQFAGGASDRYREAEEIFQQLIDPYERLYYAGILANGGRRLSSMPDSHLIRCCRFSSRLCAPLRRLKRFVRRETTMPSFGGIAVCACSKLLLMCRFCGSKSAFRSMTRIHRLQDACRRIPMAAPPGGSICKSPFYNEI